MQKRTRRMLFWIAVLVFFAVTAIALAYAQGYAYDFTKGSFVRTGAIAATVNTDATMFLNDLRIGDTSFLGNRVGKEGVLPGAYRIRISKPGFSVWQKSVSVEPGQLVDFPNVMLLPNDTNARDELLAEASRSLAESIIVYARTPLSKIPTTDFSVTADGLLYDMRTASHSLIAGHVVGYTIDSTASRLVWWSRNDIWVLWLSNTSQQPYRAEGQKLALTRFSTPIYRIGWFRDLEHIVVDLGSRTYRVLELDPRGGLNNIKL